MPPKSICTEHCQENCQKPVNKTLPRSWHLPSLSPQIPISSPKRQWGLITLILWLLNFNLLRFPLGSNTPDWKSPVSKEALQNLRESPEEPGVLQRYSSQLTSPRISHCATGHWEHPRDTGHSLRGELQFLLQAASRGEDPDNPIPWNSDTILQEVVLLKTNKVSIFHCLCRNRHHRSHEFPHHSSQDTQW